MIALSKAHRDQIDEAKAKGFLICRKAGNEKLRYAWIEDCRERNVPCVYAALYHEVADIVVNLTTTSAPRRRGGFEAIGEVCSRFVRSRTSAFAIGNEGYRVQCVRVDRVHTACVAILTTLHEYSL